VAREDSSTRNGATSEGAGATARPTRSENTTRDRTGARKRRLSLPLSLALCALLAGCQELDPNLSSGRGNVTGAAGDDAALPPPSPDDTDSGTSAMSCDMTRSQAHAVLERNCAYCHQAPANSMSVYATGQFNFILELDKITKLKSNVFTGVSYVAAGHPDSSLIYQRASNASMPPANITQRPGASDLASLRQWIASCVDGNSSGWPPPDRPPVDDAGQPGDDAADPGAGCGDPGQACCAANVCNAGGCCVGGLCHGNGLTCAAPPTPPGGQPLVGLSGTCTSGSCETSAGTSCGKVSEPCCDLSTCTASQSSCLMGMTTCSACGGTGQSCCKPNGCLDGRACINGGVGRIGTCQLCGGMGQPCCGTGSAAQQTCDPGFSCASVAGMGNLCSGDSSDAAGQGGGDGSTQDAAAGIRDGARNRPD
jgi:hypothetical protein